MSGYLQSDPVIAAWLGDGPNELSAHGRESVKAAVRRTPQVRVIVLPLPSGRLRVLLAAAALLATTVALGIAAGALRIIAPDATDQPLQTLRSPRPHETDLRTCWGPEDAHLPAASAGSFALQQSKVSLTYAIPAGLSLDAGAANGVVGLGDPYGLPHSRATTSLPGTFVGRGVVVADVTGAIRHGSLIQQPRIGTDARTFLSDLDRPIPYPGGAIDFQVDGLAETRLAGRPAWTASVSVPDPASMWTHLDRPNRDCAVELGMPNRVWVVDVGSSIVLVQAWAADQAALDAWLPDATRLAETFEFRTESAPVPASTPAAGTSTARISKPWLDLTLTYEVPDGLEFETSPVRTRLLDPLETEPMWFTVGHDTMYGRPDCCVLSVVGAPPPPVPTQVPGSRGVVVEEVTNATVHADRRLLGSDAAALLAGLAASGQFRMSDAVPAALDGRPALAARVTEGTHLDIQGGWGGISLDVPSYLLVADIGDALVVVQIWAASESELEAWLPAALTFVDSMRFSVELPT